ncbi:biliverdin-producing heme oxygenase [Paenibacillus sp. J22TS3]|uniref:biliverdin-producing heme oxygenase n=1 Tax=Paenibacillus sp. J22TS3 TaxID=2807192 RepID=UPI001B1812BD|nr:biliverdin-producing heme oxygenase [Paenibacillus sp. J22TS3]GIP21945.1 biliverdin-producing heme oxygenase [Paenibacillus sp. J22TS3]
MSANILTRLKEETAPYHIQTEQNPYASAITGGTITISEYQTYLEKFYGFVRPVEEQLAGHPAWKTYNFDFEATRKAGLLEKDLGNLGLSPQELKALPVCPNLPEQGSFAQAAGVMYVLEGSILGGQMIIRMLKPILPVAPDTNGHYFNSYGDKTRDRWKEFQGLLLQLAGTKEQENEMVEAAKDTFVKLDQWFKPNVG